LLEARGIELYACSTAFADEAERRQCAQYPKDGKS